MNLKDDKCILLFFKDFERDSLLPYDRYLKRMIRPLYRRFSKGQKVSGFFMWYQLLATALRSQGYRVYLNNYTLARKNPDYPVGLVGYPHLLEGWSLNNPAVLGPSLFEHPSMAPDLMKEDKNKFYLVTCDWMKKMFAPYYGEKCVIWYAGIDPNLWPDTRNDSKEIDVLIYDKVKWIRDRSDTEIMKPILEILAQRKMTSEIVRYGEYDHNDYRLLLSKSRSMIFLSEHETQGLACQEALTSNVPVLAWDNGFWTDPRRLQFEPEPVEATSVPYFSNECGERFKDISEFERVLDIFWQKLDTYEPRKYIERELSYEGSANTFLSYYFQAAGQNLS